MINSYKNRHLQELALLLEHNLLDLQVGLVNLVQLLNNKISNKKHHFKGKTKGFQTSQQMLLAVPDNLNHSHSSQA
jgi:hypothetical protein